MKVGLQVPNFTYPGGPASIGPNLAKIAQAAEAAGFESLWLMDHFFQIMTVGTPELEMLEGYTALGFCAAATKKIKLGTLATGVIYRYPGILVKTATTLDVLSGGRSYLGIGAAWFEQEAKGLGVPFPPTVTRFEMLEEALQIAKQMWSGNVDRYDGKHYQLAQTLCIPQPLSRPHPPIMVAGGGEKKTLRLVAQYGDACNVFGGAETVSAKLDVLKRHCENVRRDYGTIEKTALNAVTLESGKVPVKEIIALCKSLAKVGTDQALFSIPNAHEIAPLEVFGKEIIPAVAGF
jgi:F420-dependent oxidoreductase-like protein